MTKLNFILTLNNKLSDLPQDDVEERLNFFSEMIDDRIEEGMSEEEAVAAIGSIDDIVSQILMDIPLIKIVKKKAKSSGRLKAWEIVLLALGSPIWLVLVIAALAVIISLYAALWAIVISLWAIDVSLAACALAGVLASAGFIIIGNPASTLFVLGAGIACAGLSIFMFWGCCGSTKGAALLAKKIVLGIKKCFVKKEVA